ncbi:hypothetical protein OC842_006881, partial [Tilletia horrida]
HAPTTGRPVVLFLFGALVGFYADDQYDVPDTINVLASYNWTPSDRIMHARDATSFHWRGLVTFDAFDQDALRLTMERMQAPEPTSGLPAPQSTPSATASTAPSATLQQPTAAATAAVTPAPATAAATQQAGTSVSATPVTTTTAASATTTAPRQTGASTSPFAATATTAAPQQTGASTSPFPATAKTAATQRAGTATSATATPSTAATSATVKAARADLAIEATVARRLGKTLEWKEVGHGKYDGLFTKVQSGDASRVQPITLQKKAWRAPKGTNFLGYDISDRVIPQIVITAPSTSGQKISDERGKQRAPNLPMELVLEIISLAADTQRELRGLRDIAALVLKLPKGAKDPEIALEPVYIVPDWQDSRIEDFAKLFGLLPRLSDALCAKPAAVAARLNMMLIHNKQMSVQWEQCSAPARTSRFLALS